MHQNQIRQAYGTGRLQQILDLPASRMLPRGGELGWITCRPQGIESAQIVNVQTDTLKYLAVTHVLQGWPHRVWVVWLHLPMLGKVADHGISSGPAGKAFAIFLRCQALKLVSICRACCRHLSHRALSVGCSSLLEDDSSDSWEDVSSLELGWHHFCCIGGVFSSWSDSTLVSSWVPKM